VIFEPACVSKAFGCNDLSASGLPPKTAMLEN
jgi:hypothetical protein